MKKLNKIILLLVLVLIIVIAFKLAPKIYRRWSDFLSVKNGVLFEAAFNKDSDITSMGLSLAGNKTYQITNFAERYAVKMSLNRYTDEVSYRSELVPSNLNSLYFDGNRSKLGNEYWYNIHIFLPKNWEYSSSPICIMQWHESPDFDLGENWRNPPLALQSDSGSAGTGRNYFIRHRADSKKVTGSFGPYEIDEKIEIEAIENDLGRWVRWSFNVKWSYKDDGFIVVVKDGNELFRREKQKNTYNDKKGPYWKFGIYIPSWKDPAFPEYGSNSYTAYFDSIIIGNKELRMTKHGEYILK